MDSTHSSVCLGKMQAASGDCAEPARCKQQRWPSQPCAAQIRCSTNLQPEGTALYFRDQ